VGQEFTFIDLFAGCGGIAHGFMTAGFTPIGAVEIDAHAAETYSLNVDPEVLAVDIAEVKRWPEADVVVGGPPCQGFSQLGHRNSNDPRNRLWREYARALRMSGAQVFVMENVPQLLSSPHFLEFTSEVEAMGFQMSKGVLNAADYGVPQNRRRAIVIGSRAGNPRHPAPTHGTGRRPYRTVRDALSEPKPLAVIPDGKNWHRARPGVKDYSLVRYAAVPKDGGNRFQMQAALDHRGLPELVPQCWRKKVTGTTDVFGRMWWDRPAPTIRTEFFKPEKGRYLHPDADRPITVREAARFQTFPDSFRFPEWQSMVSVARQVGNAVPPLLAAAIAAEVAAHLRGRSEASELLLPLVAV
jgi:DNA (cytosine-5)-methyltransferase 1